MGRKEVDFASLKQAASHYAGERGYCTVIALAVAAGVKFGKARSAMARAGRLPRRGASIPQIVEGHRELGLKLEIDEVLTMRCQRKGIRNIGHLLPTTGTFQIMSARHISCFHNGELQDWAADARATNKRVQQIYRVLPTEE